jgi:hypothetical protein
MKGLSELPAFSYGLPRIVWVAARPPVPPFSGITGKTLCGLQALSTQADIDLVTFVNPTLAEEYKATLQQYWGGQPISMHILPLRPRARWYQGLVRCRFQSSLLFDGERLDAKLSELHWSSPDRLVIFDDIILAPLGVRYGANAILSPHDCMSDMFLSHYKIQKPSLAKIRKYVQYLLALHYEKNFYHLFLLVHVITHRDRVLLERVNPLARYHVVPNADLLNPGLIRDFNSRWDILIWGDLTIPSCARGVQKFLMHAQRNGQLASASKILIGKVPQKQAEIIIGKNLMMQIEYSPRLEDESGRIRSAKIVVIPDIGGAGIKNRVVNVLSSGLCLACLLSQMEGVEAVADRGAINAVTMKELVERIAWALQTGEYKQIAETGQRLYYNHYNLDLNYRLWREMIERALAIRERIIRSK